MVKFTTTLLQFNEQGEKTGWTYIELSAAIAQKLKPGNKKSFRVKGMLDDFAIKQVALMPMGDGKFIMPVNAAMRKGTGKQKGAKITVQLEEDKKPPQLSKEFVACLEDEPGAIQYFRSLSRSHQLYFSKWIESAKTESTKTKRIAQAVSALAKGWGYPEMMRNAKKDRDELYGA